MEKAGFIFALLVVLTGCATPTGHKYMWMKNGASQADFDRDKAQCNYEAVAATASYSTGPTARTSSGAFVQGFGEGMARGIRQNELIELCLTARGYSKAPVGSSAAMPPLNMDSETRKKLVQLVAERNGCTSVRDVNLDKLEGAVETYKTTCSDRTIEISCKFDGPVQIGVLGVPYVAVTGKPYEAEPACWVLNNIRSDSPVR